MVSQFGEGQLHHLKKNRIKLNKNNKYKN